MGIISDSDLATLRKYPQKSDLYLIIQQPRIVWMGIIGNVASGDPITSLSQVTSINTGGGEVNVLDGMTALIGTEIGDYKRGIVRVHGDQILYNNTSAQTVYIAVSSDLRNVQPGDYLTIIEEFRFWPRYPFVTASGQSTIWYKDYGTFIKSLSRSAPGLLFSDLPATTAIYPPVAIVGPHRVHFIEPGESITINYNFTQSYTIAPGKSISGYYSYGQDGGSGWTSTSGTPTVNYTSVSGMAGFRTTLEISMGAGDPIVEFRRGVRYVFTLRRPGQRQVNDPIHAEPITDFEVSSIYGTFDVGRWHATIRLFGNTTKYTVLPGALVILFADDWYGNENRSVGPISGCENIVLIGRISDGSIVLDAETGNITFDIISIGDQAARRENYAVPIENSISPTEWYQAGNLTVDRAVLWLASWHSTLPLITDFRVIGENVPISACDFLASNFYAMIDSFLSDRRYARLLFDRFERAKCEINLPMRPEGDGVEYWTLNDGDWIGELEIKEVIERPTSLVHGGGIICGTTITPALSNAPGIVARYSGTVVNKTNLAITSQDELNSLVGRHLASDNLPFRLTMQTTNWRYPDIWPQGYLVVSKNTPRYNFNNERFIFRGISYEFSDGALTARYDLDYDAHGPAGIGVYPGVTITSSNDLVQPSSPPPPQVEKEKTPSRPFVVRWPGAIIGTRANGVWCTPVLARSHTNWVRLGSGIDNKTIVDLLFIDRGSVQYLYALATDAVYAYTSLPSINGVWTAMSAVFPGFEAHAIHASTRFPGWIYYTTAGQNFTGVIHWTPNWFATTYAKDACVVKDYRHRIGIWSSPNTPWNVYIAYAFIKYSGSFPISTHIRCRQLILNTIPDEPLERIDLDTSEDRPQIANQCWVFVPQSNGNNIFYGSCVHSSNYPGGYPIRYSKNGGLTFNDGASVICGMQAYGIADYQETFYLRTYSARSDLLKMSSTTAVPFNADIPYSNAATVISRMGTNIVSGLFAAGVQVLEFNGTEYYDHTGNLAYGHSTVSAIAHYDYIP